MKIYSPSQFSKPSRSILLNQVIAYEHSLEPSGLVGYSNCRPRVQPMQKVMGPRYRQTLPFMVAMVEEEAD